MLGLPRTAVPLAAGVYVHSLCLFGYGYLILGGRRSVRILVLVLVLVLVFV